MNQATKILSEFQTKHEIGFTEAEINSLLEKHPEINKEKFNSAINRITVMVVDEEVVIYKTDVRIAVMVGLSGNLRLISYEFD